MEIEKLKIKIVCLYQVVMHYRLPFYERISLDKDFEFSLLYGKGKKGTKLVNTDLSKVKFNKHQLNDIRIPLPFSPNLFFKLIKLNPDIVLTEGSSSLINSSIAFIYAKLFRKKIIWWSLGKLKDKKYRGFRKVINYWEKIIENRCDAIFTYSTQGRDYFLSRSVNFNKIFVGVNVFDTNLKLEEINKTFKKSFLDSNFFNIAFIGTIQKTKNLNFLVDVVKNLNQKMNNVFYLHIIGDGEYFEELKNYVGDYNKVTLYGRINNDASKILKNCDVMVLPGLGGLAIVEGMLNELPIITGNADGTEIDLVGFENGFIIDPMESEKLSETLEFLFNNPRIKNKMKQESFRKITTIYSFDNYYQTFKKMIKSI
jgi:glycosyltransferase involved in cell wall biosynthesis